MDILSKVLKALERLAQKLGIDISFEAFTALRTWIQNLGMETLRALIRLARYLRMDISFEALKAFRKHNLRRAISERNAKTFPLLRLPCEIRIQIYRELLGDRFIHLKYMRDKFYNDPLGLKQEKRRMNSLKNPAQIPLIYNPRPCWLQYVCKKSGPKADDELEYLEMKQNRSQRMTIWCGVCKPYRRGDPVVRLGEAKYPTTEEVYDREMHPNLLRVCRQIYDDARSIIWTTNRFSFDSADSCRLFFDHRTDWQKAALKSLHLVVDVYQSSPEWNMALSESLIRSLEGLIDLRLFIKDLTEVEAYRKVRSGGVHLVDSHLEHLARTHFKSLIRLSRLPQLQSMNVCVAPDFWTHKSKPWFQSEKDEYAILLKERLLTKQGE